MTTVSSLVSQAMSASLSDQDRLNNLLTQLVILNHSLSQLPDVVVNPYTDEQKLEAAKKKKEKDDRIRKHEIPLSGSSTVVL